MSRKKNPPATPGEPNVKVVESMNAGTLKIGDATITNLETPADNAAEVVTAGGDAEKDVAGSDAAAADPNICVECGVNFFEHGGHPFVRPGGALDRLGVPVEDNEPVIPDPGRVMLSRFLPLPGRQSGRSESNRRKATRGRAGLRSHERGPAGRSSGPN